MNFLEPGKGLRMMSSYGGVPSQGISAPSTPRSTPTLKGNTYEEQLRSLGLFSLEETENSQSAPLSRGEVEVLVSPLW